MYFDIKKNRNESEHRDVLKRFVAWHFEQHHREAPEEPVCVLFDLQGAGLKNVVGSIYFCRNIET